MYTYKIKKKMQRMPKGLYQIGYAGHHTLNLIFGNLKQWNRKISFSQCGEDLVISYILKNVIHVSKLSYLDIGCNHPYRLNNTVVLRKEFEVKKGILVEPNPDIFKLIKRKRKKDICLNIGVGSRAGVLPYYMMNDNTLNTFSKKEAEHVARQGFHIKKCMDIKVYGINDILQKYFADGRLDFLSIDIEGNDFEVLKAIRYDKIRPAIICTETLEFMGGKDERLFELIEFYKKKDYVLAADTFLNSIFIDTRRVENKKYVTGCLF